MSPIDPRIQSPRPGGSRGEGQGEGDRALAWTASLLAAALAAYVACFAVMDTDIWWHLAAGRLMVEERRWLFTDPFAADTLGRPWVDVHWLFQVLVYLLHRWGGVVAWACAPCAPGWRGRCGCLPRSLWLLCSIPPAT
jgi:hypothetical protein